MGIRTGSVIRLTGATTIPNNEWTHLAAVYDVITGTFLDISKKSSFFLCFFAFFVIEFFVKSTLIHWKVMY